MATAKNQYSPDAVIPTEQVLKGYLEDMGLSQHDLAENAVTPPIPSTKSSAAKHESNRASPTGSNRHWDSKPTSGLESSKSTKIHWRMAPRTIRA